MSEFALPGMKTHTGVRILPQTEFLSFAQFYLQI